MKLNFKFYFNLFIIFIILLLIQGIYEAYYYKISAIFEFIPFKSQSSINPYIWSENGLVEILQNIFLISAIIYIIKLLYFYKFNNNYKFFSFFIYVYFFALCYYFFEEISWGQHIFFWDTPEFFLKYNNQAETNFHNTSNLLNELPRTLLLIWCSFSFLIDSVFTKNQKILKLKKFIFPNTNLKKISFLLLFFVAPDLIVDKFNLHPGYPIDWTVEIRFYELVDFFTFNYIRLSELHELIFDYYILSHAYYVIKTHQIVEKTYVK